MPDSRTPRTLPKATIVDPGRVLRAGAVLATSVLLLTGCAASHPSVSVRSPAATATASGIGGWPDFLPSPTTEGVAHGSTAAPAMSYPGSPVVVTTRAGDVTVDVVGPAYPADTTVGAERVRCTFAVTFSAATAAVDLGTARFDVLDHTGGIHALRVPAGELRRAVGPNRSVTIHLVATLPSGEGLLRFYPSGSAAAAGWDYVAETD